MAGDPTVASGSGPIPERTAEKTPLNERDTAPHVGAAALRARRPVASPAAVLALQRTIGNARVGRLLQRTLIGDLQQALATRPFEGVPAAQAASEALQVPALQNRRITRQEVVRWLQGGATDAEWGDARLEDILLALQNLGGTPAHRAPLVDVLNRDAHVEVRALANQQLLAVNALLADPNNANAGAPWRQKFSGKRGEAQALITKYATSYTQGKAEGGKSFREEFLDAVDKDLRTLVANQADILVGGRLMFSQKRANAKFSDSETNYNNPKVRGRLVKDVARDLRQGIIRADEITLGVFVDPAAPNGGNGPPQFITQNNRGLAALSLANFRPTSVKFVQNPDPAIVNRLRESGSFQVVDETGKKGPWKPITSPDFQMALTAEEQGTDAVAIAVTR